MDLQEFITDALIQICTGVRDANAKAKPMAPGHAVYMLGGGDEKTPSEVEFDVAVSVKSEVGGGGGGKLALKVIEADLQGKAQHTEETVSRIRFKVGVPKSFHGDWESPTTN